MAVASKNRFSWKGKWRELARELWASDMCRLWVTALFTYKFLMYHLFYYSFIQLFKFSLFALFLDNTLLLMPRISRFHVSNTKVVAGLLLAQTSSYCLSIFSQQLLWKLICLWQQILFNLLTSYLLQAVYQRTSNYREKMLKNFVCMNECLNKYCP